MNEPIELTFESPDGLVDCRLEPKNEEDTILFSATILYPNIVNGYSRSEIYCHDMCYQAETGGYCFDANDDIHPKILKLEKKISEEMILQLGKRR